MARVSIYTENVSLPFCIKPNKAIVWVIRRLKGYSINGLVGRLQGVYNNNSLLFVAIMLHEHTKIVIDVDIKILSPPHSVVILSKDPNLFPLKTLPVR